MKALARVLMLASFVLAGCESSKPTIRHTIVEKHLITDDSGTRELSPSRPIPGASLPR